ncbi:hypothetical protein [Sphingopyxis sp. 113P3]|uniref:hypothetical protein n=1 Tax=Sphingopyxis sp. (strain 113P3) TaxID=292913 RepID=UPI000AA58B33|nr:hypothetical protein [Sphingopyxis sp. 113P3]
MVEFTPNGLVAAALAFCIATATPASAAEKEWHCPEGFTPKAGLNTDFPSDGEKRAFVIVPPKGESRGPAPVWVPMVGTVEATNWNLNVPRSGNNAKLAEAGFMVIAPIRECAKQDPDLAAGACNGPGRNGWTWNPWRDGRAGGVSGDVFKTDAGPDVRFFQRMVRCVGTKWKLDRKRLYLGGISAGGTMTNRALTFDSGFWAGGLPISGEWYVTQDDGSSRSFMDTRAMVAAEPNKIWQGRVGPYPLPHRLEPMIVVTVWGGEKDLWDCGPPIGLCSDYRPSTQAGANYFSSIPGVVHVACTGQYGHRWPQPKTDEFNLWALTTLASHPKGSKPSRFKLTTPPEGFDCRVGRYTDHY